MTEEGFVGTAAASAGIAKLSARPGAPGRVEKIRSEMAAADRLAHQKQLIITGQWTQFKGRPMLRIVCTRCGEELFSRGISAAAVLVASELHLDAVERDAERGDHGGDGEWVDSGAES